ncbi:hypothetical protein F2P81_025162 [Scophthalmus maximus]|uniref:RNA helicase n=1 Tax=Scophthalmus maximus TaxID=52904 RepID=A0A6A4RJC2_SCOMX|nr:hypothetical protein F2P81_025162 [Scophthalmus maximus]
MKLKLSQLSEIGLDFFEFLKETNRLSITDRFQLKDVYNSEFRSSVTDEVVTAAAVGHQIVDCRSYRIVYGFISAQFISDKSGVSITSDPQFVNGKLSLCVEGTYEYSVNLNVTNTGTEPVHFTYYSPLTRLRYLSLTDEHNVTKSNPLTLRPGDSCDVQLHFHCSWVGIYPATLAFEFTPDLQTSSAAFHIVRFIEAQCITSLGLELAPVAPFRPRSLPAWTPTATSTIVDGQRPEGMSLMQLKNVLDLKKYAIPPYVNQLVNALKSSLPHNRRALLQSPLSWENYAEKFQLLLFLEELQMVVDMKRYNIPNDDKEEHAVMTRDAKNKKLLVLEVPGVAENRPSVLRGDELLVRPAGETGVKYRGYVHSVELNRVKLGFSSELLSRFYEGMKFSVEFTVNRLTLRLQHRAAELVEEHGLEELLFPAAPSSSAQQPELPNLSLFDWKLERNEEQFRAVKHIVAGSSRPAPYLVFGPPGTGKTVTLVEAIKQIEKTQASCRILACAPSNSAADLLCKKILDHVDDFKVFRMYASSRDPKMVPEELKACSNLVGDCYLYPPKEKLMEYRVVVTTLLTAGRLVSGGVPTGHYTHVFVDEAGHAVETECLVPLAGVSLLQRLMKKFSLYQKDEGEFNSRFVTKLLCNYRSHPAILKIPNELFYDKELQCHADEILRNSYCSWAHLPQIVMTEPYHNRTLQNLITTEPYRTLSQQNVTEPYHNRTLQNLITTERYRTLSQQNVTEPYHSRTLSQQNVTEPYHNRTLQNLITTERYRTLSQQNVTEPYHNRTLQNLITTERYRTLSQQNVTEPYHNRTLQNLITTERYRTLSQQNVTEPYHNRTLQNLITTERYRTLSQQNVTEPYHNRTLQNLITTERYRTLSQQNVTEPYHNRTLQNLITTERYRTLSQQNVTEPYHNRTLQNLITTERYRTLSQQNVTEPYHNRTLQNLITTERYRTLSQQNVTEPYHNRTLQNLITTERYRTLSQQNVTEPYHNRTLQNLITTERYRTLSQQNVTEPYHNRTLQNLITTERYRTLSQQNVTEPYHNRTLQNLITTERYRTLSQQNVTEPCHNRTLQNFVTTELYRTLSFSRGFPLIFHGVTGVDERESSSPSFFNRAEVEVLMDYVKKLLQTHGKKGLATIAPRDIGIIAPYRKQVQKIRQALNKVEKDLNIVNMKTLKVGSVEEFQGQERRVILVSTVRSSSSYMDFDTQFQLGFVKNKKVRDSRSTPVDEHDEHDEHDLTIDDCHDSFLLQRFNVAVTRAKALLIVVGNPRVLNTDATWASFMQHCSEGGGYDGVKLTDAEEEEEMNLALIHDGPNVKTFWEKRINVECQQAESEEQRRNKSALTKAERQTELWRSDVLTLPLVDKVCRSLETSSLKRGVCDQGESECGSSRVDM